MASTEQVAEPATRPRRWQTVAAGVLLTLIVASVAFIMVSQKRIDFADVPAVEPTRPGEKATLVLPYGNTDVSMWHERGILGRWYESHSGTDRIRDSWWNLRRSDTYSYPTEAVGGSGTYEVEVTVPSDIRGQEAAVCTWDDFCVRVPIER